MKLPGWTGALIHALVAGATTTVVALLSDPVWAAILVPVFAFGGWLREVAQHDLWLSLHQWIEAIAWPLGSALAWLLVVWLT